MNKPRPIQDVFYFIMKITLTQFLLMVILTSLVSAASLKGQGILDRKVSLNVQNKEIKSILSEIEKQTSVVFTYRPRLIKASKKISVKVTDANLSDVLKQLFSPEISFLAVDAEEEIILRPSVESTSTDNAFSDAMFQISVSGTVADPNGEPLPGVNVVEKGTTNGTATDAFGKFTLNVQDEMSVLVFSFIGYTTQEVTVNGRSIIDVSLTPSVQSLQEIVVIGYGTVERKDLTGAVASVGSAEIKDLAVTRADQALLGKAAGVQVKAVSGAPGAAPQIRIRGIGSISAGSDPLFVIDGFPTDNIQTLNPNDIQSIDILKDASATAIYGSRGANGVIIINTKRGKAGTAQISFDTFLGLQQASRIPATMNAAELAQYALDGMRNKNMDAGNDVSGHPWTWKFPMPQTAMDVIEGRNTTDIRMIDEILRTAPQRQYQLTATGGNENVKYALSGEHLNQEGIIINSDFKRYSLRANIDAQLSKRITLKLNLNPSFTEENITDESSEGSYGSYISASPVNKAQLWPSFFPAFDENGDYFMFSQAEAAQEWNPAAMVREIINKQKRARFLGNIISEYKIFDELKLNVLLGGSIVNTRRMRFVPELPAFAGGGAHNIATGTDNSSMNVNWITEYTLHYNKSFNNHNISGLAGFTSQKDRFESSFLTSNRYPNNLVPTLSAVSGIITNGSANINEWSLVSWLARLNYNFNSKYYVTASIRTDGSSRFGAEKRYGIFPSAALAWRVSEENFLKDVRFISDLKFRGSYGRTGNNNIGNYEHLATINYDRYTLGGVPITGFSPGRLANPLLTWETQDQINGGVDAAFFNGKLSFSVDHFRSRNSDLLLRVSIPSATGFSNFLKNIGEVKNTGWEFTVTSLNLKGNFEWTTDFNISTYKNEVVRLGPSGDPIYSTGGGQTSGANITMIGQPIGMFYGYLTDGIFMNQAELDRGPIFGAGTNAQSRPGDIRFVDFNGDGKIDSDDITIMGSPYPDFYYGMTNRFSYKNLSLSTTLQGIQGNEILNMSGIGQLNMRGARVLQLASQNNYWKSEQEPGDGKTPRPNDAPKGNNRAMSQRYIDTGSFLRITNITLGYLLPDQISQKLMFRSLRIYINSTNPFTFTKNQISFNPDVSNSGNPLTPGIDFNDYPLPKSVVIGLNAGF